MERELESQDYNGLLYVTALTRSSLQDKTTYTRYNVQLQCVVDSRYKTTLMGYCSRARPRGAESHRPPRTDR